MKFLRYTWRWLLVLIIILAALYMPDLGPETYKDFDSFFSNERTRQGIAGYEVAIIKDGRLIFNKAYGFDGQRRPLTQSTPIYIGPSSEIFTGALLAQMVNQRKISLDVPMRNFCLSLLRSKSDEQEIHRSIYRSPCAS